MITLEQHSICKPLLHHMYTTPPLSSPKPLPNNVDVIACHLHHTNICPIHGNNNERHSLVASFLESNQPRVLVACSANMTFSTCNNNNGTSQCDQDFHSIDFNRERKYEEIYERNKLKEREDLQRQNNNKGRASWPEENLKKTFEKLCEQIQWTSKKHYQELARSNFQEILHCQASIHALHEDSIGCNGGSFREEGEEDLCGKNGYYFPLRSGNQNMLSLSELHSPYSEATFIKQFWGCKKERPMSVSIHKRMQRVILPRRNLVQEDLVAEHFVRNCVWTPYSRKEGCVGNRGVKPKEEVVVPLHSSPSLQNVDCFRSKSVELKKPRFCNGINYRKGEIMLEDATKKMLKVLPIVVLHRDEAKSLWNRKTNKKEWNVEHRRCCSQHWVSLLDNNKKVCHLEEKKLSTIENSSPTPKQKEMAMQKLQVARSLDLSSSLSSLKAIVHDMSRPQSASLLQKNSNVTLSVDTRRSSNTCKSNWKSIVVPPIHKLKNPEFNSSVWLLAKMEALKNETFTKLRALQIAKKHGIILDKEDEAAFEELRQLEQSP